MSDNTEALPPLERAIDDYLDGYVLEGDDGYHLPTEHEKLIVKDAIMGLLEEPAFSAALAQRQQVPELWLVVRESVLDVGQGDDVRTGGRPELGYALIANAATFTSEGEARAAIRAAGLPIGWVYMPLSRLLPDLHERINGAPALTAAPSAQPAATATSVEDMRSYGEIHGHKGPVSSTELVQRQQEAE